MKARLLLLLCLSLLTSCGAVPKIYVKSLDSKKVAIVDTGTLLFLHHRWELDQTAASPEARRDLEGALRKRGITNRDFDAMRTKRPYIGMRAEVLAEVLGKPKRINFTQTRYGTSQQLIYGNRMMNQPYYFVYVDNGRVTAIQNNPLR